jgi:hypothetical protein
MTAFFDASASPLVNRAADTAVDFINSCTPALGRPIDLHTVCRWSADAVAPKLSEEQRAMLAEAARRRVIAVRVALMGAAAA